MRSESITKEFCTDCGVVVNVSVNTRKTKIRCQNCTYKMENQVWFKKMKRRGCDVADASKLGDVPWLKSKTLADCPKVKIDNTRYIDVTSLFFEDTSQKKEYLTLNEMRRREEESMKEFVGVVQLREGAKPGRDKKELTKEEEIKIIELYNDNYSYWDISQISKVGMHRITEYLKGLREDGILKSRGGRIRANTTKSNKKNKRYTEEEKKIIVEMHKEGKSFKEIAERFQKTIPAIFNLIKRMKNEGKY